MSVHIAWVFVAAFVAGGMSFILAAALCAKGDGDQREEVRDALRIVNESLNEACGEGADANYALLDEDIAEGYAAVHRSLRQIQRAQTWLNHSVDLLGYSRSVLDSWNVAPVTSTFNAADTHCQGDGGNGRNGTSLVNTTSLASGPNGSHHVN